jgi:hypothetical protein
VNYATSPYDSSLVHDGGDRCAGGRDTKGVVIDLLDLHPDIASSRQKQRVKGMPTGSAAIRPCSQNRRFAASDPAACRTYLTSWLRKLYGVVWHSFFVGSPHRHLTYRSGETVHHHLAARIQLDAMYSALMAGTLRADASLSHKKPCGVIIHPWDNTAIEAAVNEIT